MEPVTTPIDQLISQTHRLSLRSAYPDPPSCPSSVPGMNASSPATDMVADAQPADDKTGSNLKQRTALSHPSSSGMLAGRRDVACDHNGNFSGSAVQLDALGLDGLPNEILLHILSYLDVSDLLSTSRTSHLLREISTAPILHHYRLRRTRSTLPPLLWSPSRPSLADLISRHIFLTTTSVVSRRLARSLVSIRLSRRLAARPTAVSLVERSVLPKECVPGLNGICVAPGLVSKKMAIEKERIKDGLRQWIASIWRGKVREREEGVKRWEESQGVGRVWRLRKFWERVSHEGEPAVTSR